MLCDNCATFFDWPYVTSKFGTKHAAMTINDAVKYLSGFGVTREINETTIQLAETFLVNLIKKNRIVKRSTNCDIRFTNRIIVFPLISCHRHLLQPGNIF